MWSLINVSSNLHTTDVKLNCYMSTDKTVKIKKTGFSFYNIGI